LAFFEGKIDLIKIDVERFQLSLPKGCKKILLGLPNIALELHFAAWKSNNTALEDIFTLIDLSNYHAYYLQ
jgi:hypothetical protein